MDARRHRARRRAEGRAHHARASRRPQGDRRRAGRQPERAAIGPDGALYVCNSGGWDFHEIGDFTIPQTELPARPFGRPHRARRPRDRRRAGALHRVRRQSADRPERHRVRRARRHVVHRSRPSRRVACSTSAAIYYAQPDGSSIREVVFPSDSPNGIGLSPDGTRLYAAETHTGRLYVVERHRAGRGRAQLRRARPARCCAACRGCSSSTRSASTATATSWSRPS